MTWYWFWTRVVGVGAVYAIFVYTATRVANWQDNRRRTKRIQRIADEITADINTTLKSVTEATEEVNRARQQERRCND